MNKQVILAGILGATSAQTPCDGPFVAAAAEEKLDLEGEKTALEAKTAALTAMAATEQTAFDTAQGRSTTQTTLIAPFNTALADATTKHAAQTAIKTTATTALTAANAAVATATTNLTTAESAVTAQNTKITDQNAVIVKLQKAVDEHTVEKATMQTALTTATTAVTTTTTAETAAIAAKTALETTKGTASTGQDAILATKTSEASVLEGTYNTAVTTQTDYYTNTYKALLKAKQKTNKNLAIMTAACSFTDGSAYNCTGQTNDPILALKTASSSASGTADTNAGTPKTTWDTHVTAQATAQDAWNQKVAEKEVAQDNVTTISSAITTATGDVTTATAAKTTATTAQTNAQNDYNTVDGQLTQATADLGRGNTILTALQAELLPLTDDVVVKKYLKGIEDAKVVAETAAKDGADGKLPALLNLKTMAQATVDRAQTTLNFYAGLLATAQTSKTQADGLVAANAAAITAKGNAITAATNAWTQLVTECKEAGYEQAQAALKAKIDKEAAEAAAAATVKTDYDAKSAFATGGETNTLCAYPAKAKDAAQEPRPACKDGFCCGAAQKFLKDGTKLAIETCQKNTGVHTYQYYPPLPTGAAVEPTAETWRFQCISGAQKLVATATAALAASYMMA